MAAEKSVGSKAEERWSSWEVLQLPRQILWPSGERTISKTRGIKRRSRSESRHQGVLCQSCIRGLTSLNVQRVEAKAKHVVVRVLRRTVGGATERTRQKLGPALVGAGTLALVVPNSPETFVKKFLEMTASALV